MNIYKQEIRYEKERKKEKMIKTICLEYIIIWM
jgi:hypothetical protein